MSRLFVVLCENGLNRDENLLRGLLHPRAVRVIPCLGPSLDDKAARIARREAQRAGTEVVLVVHRDADDETLQQRREEIDRWVKEQALLKLFARIIKCVPVPCSERWLCFGGDLKTDGKATKNSCAPWKKRWERERQPEWKRMAVALTSLRAKGRVLADFELFLRELGD